MRLRIAADLRQFDVVSLQRAVDRVLADTQDRDDLGDSGAAARHIEEMLNLRGIEWLSGHGANDCIRETPAVNRACFSLPQSHVSRTMPRLNSTAHTKGSLMTTENTAAEQVDETEDEKAARQAANVAAGREADDNGETEPEPENEGAAG